MERRSGRPSLGLAAKGNFLRLPQSAQERVEAMARRSGITRAAVLRALVTAQLTEIAKSE
jgi:predicted DNA-binding protein